MCHSIRRVEGLNHMGKMLSSVVVEEVFGATLVMSGRAVKTVEFSHPFPFDPDEGCEPSEDIDGSVRDFLHYLRQHPTRLLMHAVLSLASKAPTCVLHCRSALHHVRDLHRQVESEWHSSCWHQTS